MFADFGPECSGPLIAIPAETSVHRAATTMAIEHIRKLRVIKNEKIVGIITARQLVDAYAK